MNIFRKGVQGFPTVKLYPRGASAGSMTYEAPERTASGFYYWATRGIPNMNTKLFYVEDIAPWVEKVCCNLSLLYLFVDHYQDQRREQRSTFI